MWKGGSMHHKTSYIGRSVGQPYFCICALRCIAVHACACSHSITVFVAYSTSSHLSLFSCATRNNCPKLAQGCNQPLPRVSYALHNQLQITIFLKANLEFSYLCPRMLQMSPSKTYIKYASWFIISPMLLFLTRFFFLFFFFLLPPPLNRSKALKAAYGISCF